jgi:tetratricopeptide (TPR) repeat protein
MNSLLAEPAMEAVMKRQGSVIGILFGMCVAAMVLAATPAFAQVGSLQGRVVDESGAPVPDAEVALKYSGELNFNFTVKTDRNGRWIRAGLMAVGGRWTITASKDGMIGVAPNVEVPLNAAANVPDITIRKAVANPAAGMSDAEIAARNKQAAETKKLLEEVNAALASNSYDVALTKLTEATTKIEKCTSCYVRMGDVYVKQNNPTKAEEAYKQATTLDDKSQEAWEALAIFYNAQKKFDLAGEASTKAMALQSAAGGPADATSAYNAGVILSNQRKMPEARAMFEKAIQMNPKMADAHYQLAMAYLNENKMAEAVKSLEQFLVLEPAGPNTEMAKVLLAEAKKLVK